MATTQETASPIFEVFEPAHELVQEPDCDTILLYLPGYNRQQLRARLSSTNLRITGERPLEKNKRERFAKEFPVSDNCDASKITAKFEGTILYVRLPKITPAADKEPLKPADEPRAQEKHLQEQAAAEKAASQEDAAEKARPKAEDRTPDEKKDNGSADVKNEEETIQENKTSLPDKSLEERTPDEKESNGSGDVKNGGETMQENKMSLPDKSSDEGSYNRSSRSSSSSYDEDKKKKTSDQPKSTDSINATETDSRGTPWRARPTSYGGITAGGNAARLKTAWRVTNVVLAVLVALYLALCVRNLITFSRSS